jgi:hypothetical protein
LPGNARPCMLKHGAKLIGEVGVLLRVRYLLDRAASYIVPGPSRHMFACAPLTLLPQAYQRNKAHMQEAEVAGEPSHRVGCTSESVLHPSWPSSESARCRVAPLCGSDLEAVEG